LENLSFTRMKSLKKIGGKSKMTYITGGKPFFFDKIKYIHSFKLKKYIDIMQIR